MKRLLLLVLASASLTGCVVVPVGDPPGMYVAPIAPAVVLRPHGHGYYGGPRYRGWR